MIKLKSLQLKNYRGFEELKFDFDKNFTCIAGVNGSGKTTILGAIERSMLYFLKANHLGEYRRPKYALNATDVHLGMDSTFIEQSETACSELEFLINDTVDVIKHSFKKIGRTGNYYPPNYNGNGFKDAKNCPIFAFYSINRRNVSTRSQKQINGFAKIFSAWENVNLVNFDCFFNWYKNELLDEYQSKDNNPSYRNNELHAVQNAIYSFFEDSIRLKIEKDHLIAIKNGVELLFSSISDGEKSIALLFADIARRLAIVNQNLNNPLEGDGVILIDEIELHLHPSWQRKICRILKRTFPNCQFVITTHSPQVLGELQPCEIRLLKNFEILNPSQSFGLDSNTILDSLQSDSNVSLKQNSEISREIDNISSLIDNLKFDDARAKLQNLEMELHGSTPETVSLATEIALMEASE